MTDNSFEKQIAEKLSRMEMQPSEGLLERVFEERAARSQRYSGIGYAWILASVAVITAVAVSVVMSGPGVDEGKQELAADIPVTAPAAVSTPGAEPGSGVKETNADRSASSVSQPRSGSITADAGTSTVKMAGVKSGKGSTAAGTLSLGNRPQTSGFKDGSDYFNTSSLNRPEIVDEFHSGNSHFYTYRTATDMDYADHGFVFSRLENMRKKEMTYAADIPGTVLKSDETSPLKGKRRVPVFADILFSPSLGIHYAAGNGETEEAASGLARSAYSSQAGIRISVPVSGRLNVFTGAFLRQQHNHYRGDLQYTEQATRIDKHTSYINDPVKGVIEVTTYDTVNYSSNRTQSVDHRNLYKMLQIPLGISYNFGYGKFDFAMHGSVLVNVFTESRGRALDLRSHSTREFSSGSKYAGLGAGLSFMAAYRVSPAIRIIAEPGLQYFGINAVRAGNNIRENSFGSHFTVGLRYTLF